MSGGLLKSNVGKAPFRKSKMKVTLPAALPRLLVTFVAPILPEPCSRMSTPFAFDKSKPTGIEPTKNAITGSM